MRALVYTETGKVELQDRPEPVPGPDEVRVDVELVGICGSDILGYQGRSPGRLPPLVLGHEFTARWEGRPVVVNPIVSCGTCEQCRTGHENLCPRMRLAGLHHDGALRERITVPSRNLVILSGDGPHHAMVLAEPLACSLHATNLVPDPGRARSLVIGFGCLGYMTAAMLRYLGARWIDIVEKSTERVKLAERLQANPVFATDVRPGAYDNVYDCVGHANTRALSMKAARPGGHIVLIGYGEPEGGVDFTEVVRREIHLHGVMAYTAGEFRQSVDLLREGILDAEGLIRIHPFHQGQHAFDEARTSKSRVIKTAICVSGNCH